MQKLKSIGKWLCIIGSIILLAGAIVFVCGMAAENWDFSKLATVRYIERSFEQNGETINAVDLDFRNVNVEIEISDNVQGISLTYPVREGNDDTAAAVKDNVLTLKDEAWNFSLFAWDFGAPAAKLTLPSHSAVPVDVCTGNGDVKITGGYYTTLKIQTGNGDIALDSTRCASLSAETDNGDITMSGVCCSDDLSAETDNGNITATGGLTASSVRVFSDLGDITFTGGTTNAEYIEIATNIGDVKAELAGNVWDYTVTAVTDIGNSNISSGGNGQFILKVTTDIGDINITFEK